MEDLDSLLEDLGRGKSGTQSRKSRPPSSRVDLNELEDLMEDLAAPTPKQAPQPTPVSFASAASTASSPASAGIASPPAPASSSSAGARSQAVVSPTAPSSNNISANGGGSAAAADELDALMESLNASSRSNRRSAKPAGNTATPAAATASAPAQPQQTQPQQQTQQPTARPQPRPVVAASAPAPPTAVSTPVAKPAVSSGGDDLDALLSNLTTQMNQISTSANIDSPLSRGTCNTCKQPIFGEVIQASGKAFHPEHFVCGNCKSPLGTGLFFEQGGQTLCERCYQEMFCPRCAHCEKPVMDRCITALGKKWHVEHFICTQCLNPFNGGNFFEKDGRPYCEADFFNLFAPKCAGCNEPIKGDCINALGTQWHPEHFACAYCSKAFGGGTFFEYNGKPYCEIHYHLQLGSLCSGCGKPIAGRCVNALNKKWHPEHFVCAFCMNPLAGGSFTEHNSKAYCRECHSKLFGNN